MNSITIGGGNYDVGREIMAEQARRAALELDRQRMMQEASLQAARMQQEARANAQSNAMRMQQAQRDNQMAEAKFAWEKQLENAKLAEAQRFRGVDDERANAQFGATMEYHKAQLSSLNEDRTRRGDEFKAKLASDEEMKTAALEAKQKAEAQKAVKANINRLLRDKQVQHMRVQRELQRPSTLASKATGEQHLASLESDIGSLQSALESDQLDIPEQTLDSAALSKWQGEAATAQAEMLKEEDDRNRQESKDKEADRKAKSALDSYKTADPLGSIAAVQVDPNIPEEIKPAVIAKIRLLRPMIGELETLRDDAANSESPLATLDLNIANREEYLATPIQRIRGGITAIQKAISEGDNSGSEALKMLEDKEAKWMRMDAVASVIAEGHQGGKQAAMKTVIDRLKEQRKQWAKDPEILQKEKTRSAASPDPQLSEAIKRRMLEATTEDVGTMEAAHAGPLHQKFGETNLFAMRNQGLYAASENGFGGSRELPAFGTLPGDLERNQASRALYAKLKSIKPPLTPTQIAIRMNAAQLASTGQ